MDERRCSVRARKLLSVLVDVNNDELAMLQSARTYMFEQIEPNPQYL